MWKNEQFDHLKRYRAIILFFNGAAVVLHVLLILSILTLLLLLHFVVEAY